VLGDSGTAGWHWGAIAGAGPVAKVAKLLMGAGQTVPVFVLAPGDLVYQVGSSEQYRRNFIRP